MRREGTTEKERRKEGRFPLRAPFLLYTTQTYSVVLNGYDSTSSAVRLSLYRHHVNVVWKLEMAYLEKMQSHINQSINKLSGQITHSLNQSITHSINQSINHQVIN